MSETDLLQLHIEALRVLARTDQLNREDYPRTEPIDESHGAVAS
jgi:hypothetical protein